MLNSEEGYSPIEKLYDDCLIQIFEYLPIVDRIRSEAVSKKWQSLIQISWSSFKQLSFRGLSSWTHSEDYDFDVVINDEIFKKLMIRFGKYLVNIDFCSAYPEFLLSSDSVRYICQFCPNLQALHLGKLVKLDGKCYNESKEIDFFDCKCQEELTKIIQTLQDWMPISSLKKFGVYVCHLDPDDLSFLISRMMRLESLHIMFSCDMYSVASCLIQLPFSTLNEIVFGYCATIEEELLIEAVKSVPKLRTLILTELNSYNVLHHLSGSQHETLENLYPSIWRSESEENLSQDIRVFQNFINLKRLSLRSEPLIVDECLEIIAHYCKHLIFLDISESHSRITDNGIKHIVFLPELKYLYMSGLEEITGKTLNRIANLEVLECTHCNNLEDEGLCAIIRESKLRFLDITSSKKVTNKVLFAVINEQKARQNKSDFVFNVRWTQIKVNKKTKLPPLLDIINDFDPSDRKYTINGFFPGHEQSWDYD